MGNYKGVRVRGLISRGCSQGKCTLPTNAVPGGRLTYPQPKGSGILHADVC